MAIGKPRGKNGARPVYVYDPARGRKVYVGSRVKLRGEGGAQELEREKQAEFAQRPSPTSKLTFAQYASDWLVDHHGDGTRRPAPGTHTHNRDMLRPFLAEFGHREVDAGIGRREALRWARQHPHNATVVAAMLNDAIDDEVTTGNPFARRRQEESRERKHIHPLTEAEVNQLADIAHRHWGADGYGWWARAWVLFGAWVGCRPGETFGSVAFADLDFERGEVTIRRVKKRGRAYPTDVVVLPRAAQDAVRDAIRHAGPAPTDGPLFRTVSGVLMGKGGLRYHWEPIRSGFREKVTTERWRELLDDSEDRKTMDFYVLRHFCASVMADRGLNAKQISGQLGNSEQVCQETYIHLYRDRSNDAVRRALEAPTVVDLASARARKGA